MKTSDNEWQWVTASDTMGDNEWDNKWQGVVQRMKMNESEWEQPKESDFGFRMKQNMQSITTIHSAI